MAGEQNKKRQFDREFKISTVKMVTDGGHKAAEVARSLGIHETQIYNWKKKFRYLYGESTFPAIVREDFLSRKAWGKILLSGLPFVRQEFMKT